MKILFLNVWRGEGGNKLWKFIENNITMMDVFCFQESDDAFDGLGDIFSQRYTVINFLKPVTNRRPIAIKTLVKNGLNIDRAQKIWTEGDDIGGAIMVKVDNLTVANVHGTYIVGDDKKDVPVRLRQSQEIIEMMGKVNGPKIIGGDFNVDIDTESVRMFEKAGYKNLIKEYGIKTTRNKLSWEKWPGREQMYADFVFVSPEVRVKNFEVLDVEVSDHLPMMLEIEE